MRKELSVRSAILDAAIRILQESGVKDLTQPKVAKAAGVRQSHLTYYFPKKTDLVAALLQQHLHLAAADKGDHGHAENMPEALSMIAQDPRRMRFFLSLIVEAQHDIALKSMVEEHIAQFDAQVAAYYGREAGDADVALFLSALRGFGLCNLAHAASAPAIDIARLAERFGLHPRKRGEERHQTKGSMS